MHTAGSSPDTTNVQMTETTTKRARAEAAAAPEPAVVFYAPRDENGCLSNFSAHPIRFVRGWGDPDAPGVPAGARASALVFRTAEHAVQHDKAVVAGDAEAAARILAAETPAAAKALGREVRWSAETDAKWTAHRPTAALVFLRLKAAQHPGVAAALEATGRRRIAEAAPRDRVWGVGVGRAKAADPANWRGANLLGATWETVRAERRAAADAALLDFDVRGAAANAE